MSIKKDYLSINFKSYKLHIAAVLIGLIGVSFLIRLTPLIKVYFWNLSTAVVMSNAISLIVISLLLIALHIVDLKRFKEALEKEDEDNVH